MYGGKNWVWESLFKTKRIIFKIYILFNDTQYYKNLIFSLTYLLNSWEKLYWFDFGTTEIKYAIFVVVTIINENIIWITLLFIKLVQIEEKKRLIRPL